MQNNVATAETMDKNNSLFIVGTSLALILGILLSKPKQLSEGIIGFLAGLFAGIVIAPFLSEVLTRLSASISWLFWIEAKPESATYTFITCVCFLIGMQMTMFIYNDVWQAIKSLFNRRIKKIVEDAEKSIND